MVCVPFQAMEIQEIILVISVESNAVQKAIWQHIIGTYTVQSVGTNWQKMYVQSATSSTAQEETC